MKVIATKMGFFNGNRQREGSEFEVPDGTKGSWFVPVGTPVAAKTVKAVAARKAATPEPTTLSKAGAGKSQSFVEAMAKKDGDATDLA